MVRARIRLPPMPPVPRARWARRVEQNRAFGMTRTPAGYRRVYWLHRRRFYSPRVRALAMRTRARVRGRLSAARIPGEVINHIMAYANW